MPNRIRCFWCSKLLERQWFDWKDKIDVVCRPCKQNLRQLNLGKRKGKRIVMPKTWHHGLLSNVLQTKKKK